MRYYLRFSKPSIVGCGIPSAPEIENKDPTLQKKHGVHYTPEKLARFLAAQTAQLFARLPHSPERLVHILDPACGDGELLIALIDALPCTADRIQVTGFEMDAAAANLARQRIEQQGVAGCQIEVADFLDLDSPKNGSMSFDVVIANPPYVRTQVLGGIEAQQLAKKFGLTGRVDLYQAFAVALSVVLGEQGVLGLLTSNRFLTVKSGMTLRARLAQDFEIRQVFDLGDTRLFDAAVLPVIVTAVKRSQVVRQATPAIAAGFHRAYLADSLAGEPSLDAPDSILNLLAQLDQEGVVEAREGRFRIDRGSLLTHGQDSVWSLSNSKTRRWLKRVRTHQAATFGELAEIKVGIKTTADAVFIRDNWDELKSSHPEPELLRPLLTHYDARRWSVSQSPRKTVLYPYKMEGDRRSVIDLRDFPNAASYLELHRPRLASRKYLNDAGRRWYEIWVPHQPTDWQQPKIVWPDISQSPKFFLDGSGGIVNGDCYWIKLRSGCNPDWIYLMLAVANSSVATTFYDTVFHNKLYAGRRRFMTQYVKEFPLPRIDSAFGKKIVRLTKTLVETPTVPCEQALEMLVQAAFGLGSS
jgi:hypothetical protein